MIYSSAAREKCQILQFNNEELPFPFKVNTLGEYKTTSINMIMVKSLRLNILYVCMHNIIIGTFLTKLIALLASR